MNIYSASPYPLLDGNNGADTPGAFFFRRKSNNEKNKKTTAPPQSTLTHYEPSIAHSDATTLVMPARNGREASFIRPSTPAHGSRDEPWRSYRDLSREHPVFAYSEDVRAELYSRGIDPVVQAEVDAAKQEEKRSGTDGRMKGFWRQSASRWKNFAAC